MYACVLLLSVSNFEEICIVLYIGLGSVFSVKNVQILYVL